ncbi:MAG: hypothetical protein R3A79_29220 [Nannocystaceae bacterium]
MAGVRTRSRLPRWIGLALVAGLLAPRSAAAEVASTCAERIPAFANLESPLRAQGTALVQVPVDAAPWVVARCAAPEVPAACVLRDLDDPPRELAVDVEHLAEACADPETDYVVRFRPERLLLPSRRYALHCETTPLAAGLLSGDRDQLSEEAPVTDLQLVTKGSTVPSRAPVDLAGAEAEHLRQDDTGCCGDPLYLVVRTPTGSDAERSAGEGGIVEIEREGEVWVALPGEAIQLPWTDEGIRLTAVGANGTRGEPVTIPIEAIDEELIYTDFGCALRRPPPLALWLLAPLVLLRWSTRRRRREARP